jgi:carboxyl-terminal processing protease
MKRNTLLIVIGGIAAVLLLCVCTVSVLGAGFFLFADDLIAAVRGIESEVGIAPSVTDDPQALATSTAQAQIFLGDEDIDLFDLFSPVWESRSALRDHFVEQPVEDEVLAAGALEGLTAYVAEQGVSLEAVEVSGTAPSAEQLAAEAETPEEAQAAFAPYWEAWRKVQFGDTQVAGTYLQLMRSSLAYMVQELGDPHTSFMDPIQLQQSNMTLEGEYEGIGAFVDTTTEYVTIIAPMDGSPAKEAGLQPGDMVLAVDGKDMTDVPGDVVISYILGPAGTEVVLTIEREDEAEPFDVSVIRAHIVVPSVISEILEGDIAYLQLTTFGADSAADLRNALEELLDQNPAGLILDLRNNGGGYLYTAVEITSEFVPTGVALYEEYGDGARDEYNVNPGGLATEIPLVVLVNGGTASASEILAGAIQDFGRAVLVGETTFGKGSVQTPIELSNGEGALRVTIAYWYTPDNRLIHGVGLEPDYVVPLTEEDVEQELDPQLDRAIELIREQQ